MPNRLINEHSLYLRQHAHNPVNWYPWCGEAFERAKTENKPVLVSIGYAACHWCHVMERESFEDAATAAYMNEHFICIKVDREERPDVDSVYMDAVQAITGSGGWPLNVFVTPDKIPFYGGTYFPPRPAYGRASWQQVLTRIQELWQQEHEAVLQQVDQMKGYLTQVAGVSAEQSAWDEATLSNMTTALLKMSDTREGGFGRAPKFPGSMAISFLLDRYRYEQDEAALAQALLSLDKMAAGGIYDQLGGGFARYSTDNQWLAPHFEKMLYDNALLIITYAQAYRLTGKERYRQVVNATIAFVNRELKDPESNGFYSAIDADSEGMEGKFYTFTWQEWQEALGKDMPLAARYFGITKAGNWEGTNILHQAESWAQFCGQAGLSPEEATAQLEAVEKKLWQAREQRIRPATDDKILLSWNALMNLALTTAAIALQNKGYLQQAKDHMAWLLHNMAEGDALYHVWRKGVPRIAAHLDDYAFLIQALLQLGSVGGEDKWLAAARQWTMQTMAAFADTRSPFFFFTAAHQTDMPLRKIELQDGATPSANAMMAHNLLLLGLTDANTEWLERGRQMLQGVAAAAERYPYSFAYWCQLLQLTRQGLYYVVVKGRPMELKLLAEAPPHLFVIRESGGGAEVRQVAQTPGYFICSATECLPPLETWEAVMRFVNEK